MILSVGLAIGLLGGSVLALNQKQNVKVAKGAAEDTYIPFTIGEGGNFTINGTSGTPGEIAQINDTSWSGRFLALDSYYRGEKENNWHGKIVSKTWIQKTRYIAFTWGGRAEMSIEFYKANGTLIGSMTNDLSNGNPMVVNYYTIPTETVSDQDLQTGVEMRLELVDDYDGGGYGFHNFGYLHPNTTLKGISDIIWQHINSFTIDYDPNASEINMRIRETINHYLNNPKFNGILTLSDNKNIDADEGFENNTVFLQNWYRDTRYDEGFDFNRVHADAIISNSIQHSNGLSYNKSGSGFFKGYYEDAYNLDGNKTASGFYPDDNVKYRFVSKPFVLSGTGFISVKMAGRSASLHVVKGNVDLAYIDNQGWNNGLSCTMIRHVINLSEFLGDVIQIAISDFDTGGDWGAVNYDELVTNYSSTNPLTFKVDGPYNHSNEYSHLFDKYVSSVWFEGRNGLNYTDASGKRDAHRSEVFHDTTDVAKAHDFLVSYFNDLRKSTLGYSVCGFNTDMVNTLKNLVDTKYKVLDSNVKSIVDASQDFDYGDSKVRNDFTVGQTIDFLVAKYNLNGTQSQSIQNTFGGENSLVAILIVTVSLSLVLGAAFLFFKKKKQEN